MISTQQELHRVICSLVNGSAGRPVSAWLDDEGSIAIGTVDRFIVLREDAILTADNTYPIADDCAGLYELLYSSLWTLSMAQSNGDSVGAYIDDHGDFTMVAGDEYGFAFTPTTVIGIGG